MTESPESATTPDSTPTEALQLADQQPVSDIPPTAAAAPAPQAAHRSHTRTILEVGGGVVAAGLILVAGAVGFLVGHATGSDNDGRGGYAHADGFGGQPDAGGMMGGQQGRGQGHGQQGQGFQGQPGQGFQGQDPRGIDPDGDNWTGGGMMEGEDDDALPATPATPSQQG
jgi:hypothetical protein